MKSNLLEKIAKTIKKLLPTFDLCASVLLTVIATYGFCDSFKPSVKEKCFLLFMIMGGISVYESCMSVTSIQKKEKISKGDIVDYIDQRGCAVLSLVLSVNEKEQIATVSEITGQQRIINVSLDEIQDVYKYQK